MAKFEPIEVIMRLSEARASDKGEICIQADKVQDLVRCKDCKHRSYWHTDTDPTPRWERCELFDHEVTGDDFCSRGEPHER